MLGDAIVKHDVLEQHRQLLSSIEVQIVPNAGHAPFQDDPSAFNRRLGAFAEQIARASHGASGK